MQLRACPGASVTSAVVNVDDLYDPSSTFLYTEFHLTLFGASYSVMQLIACPGTSVTSAVFGVNDLYDPSSTFLYTDL